MKKNKLIEFDDLYKKTYADYYFVGIDEVGRGALVGPVIACAFAWKKNVNLKKNYSRLLKLNDSKQLTKKERNNLYFCLTEFGEFGLGYASVLEIEKLNILNATFLAMKRAYDNLVFSIGKKNVKTYVLVDGNKFVPYINSRQISIVDGDAKSSLIASASIIAKVYRDMLMEKISKLKFYKKYGWSRNVGYGTDFHRRAIRKHGTTPLHRKLFVRKTLALVGVDPCVNHKDPCVNPENEDKHIDLPLQISLY